MGIREHVAKALANALLEGLLKESARLVGLEHAVQDHSHFDIVLTPYNNGYLVLTPFNPELMPLFGNAFDQAVRKSLARYKPAVVNKKNLPIQLTAGSTPLLAYALTKKASGRLPAALHLDVHGLHFEVGLVHADLSTFLSSSEPQNIQPPHAVSQEEPYIPDVNRGDQFDIALNNHTCLKYHLFLLTRETRPHFPGYRVPFQIHFDNRTIDTHVASAPGGTPVGAFAGNYISKNIKEIYDAHPELEQTRRLTMRVQKPGELYHILRYGR